MGQKVQSSIPALGKAFFTLFYMDTKEIEVIKNHRPISHGPFFRRRSIGPLPSCFIDGTFEKTHSRNSLLLLLLRLFLRHVLLDGVVQDGLDAERLHAVDAWLDALLKRKSCSC